MYRIMGVVLFVFVVFIGSVSAKNLEFKKQCGEFNYVIVIDNADTYDTATIKHYYQIKDTQKKLFHQSEHGMFVSASCTKDKNNSDVFVFTEICGGSGCLDDIYGLFDLKQKKMLLTPSDWPKGNEEEVIKILGKADFVENHNDFYRFADHEFCCIRELVDFQKNRLEEPGTFHAPMLISDN